MRTSVPHRPLRVLALLEADAITGPAKSLIELCRVTCRPGPGTSIPPMEMRVVSFRRAGDETQRMAARSSLERALGEAGVIVERVWERFRFDGRVLPQLRGVAAAYDPDVVESHSVKSHTLVRLARLALSRPWVAFHHGYTTTDVKMRLYNLLDGWSLRRADRVVTVCSAFVPELLRRGVRSDRLRVVHSAISPAPEAPDNGKSRDATRAQLGIALSDSVIISVSRLSKEKGLDDLLQAFARLLNTDLSISAKLLVVGDGPERPRLSRRAASLGIAGRVVFTGHVLDTRPYLATADAFALASHSEGSTLALLEALQAGVPVVATAVGGVPEMVTHQESALLVPPRDPPSLSRALARLLSDPPLRERLARSGRKLLARQFSPYIRAATLVELYEETVAARTGARKEA